MIGKLIHPLHLTIPTVSYVTVGVILLYDQSKLTSHADLESAATVRQAMPRIFTNCITSVIQSVTQASVG